MLYLGYAEDLPGTAEKRLALRDEHMDYLHHEPEVLVLGGPLMDGADARLGTFLLIDAPDMATAQKWFADEPFNKGGLFESMKVTRVKQGHWHPERVTGDPA